MSGNLKHKFFISDKMTLGERINYIITKNTIEKLYVKLEFILYLEKNSYLRISKWISILTGKGTIPSDALQVLKNEYGIGNKKINNKSERRVALRKEVNDILNEDLNISAKVIKKCASTTISSESNIKKMLIGTLCPQDNVIKYFTEKYKYPFYANSSDEERFINYYIKRIIMEVDGEEFPRFNLSMSLEKRIEYFEKAKWFYDNIKTLENKFKEYRFIYDYATDIEEFENLILNKINEHYEDSILFPDEIDENDLFISDKIMEAPLSIEEKELANLYKWDEILKRYVC